MDSSGATSISKKANQNQNIQVYVRVRPLNSRERSIRSNEVVETLPKEILVRYSHDLKMKKFTFDRAFGQDSKQCDVYHTVVAPFIEEVLSGYNCTVFAYGQTGTGKTHTMVGFETPELQSSWDDESMVGIIPRAVNHLFDELRLMELEYTMRVSYLELYNEELCDLLSSDDSIKIRIFDDSTKKGSVIIQGLEEIIVNNKNDVYKLLENGKERRKTASTLMNAQSSRSHTVFSILVHIKESGIDGEEMLKIGKLNLVDLAGSENISKAGNEKGIRTRETVNINQSLLTLGRVITALVERTPHIPYRESKLTRLLQESLGGRTKTSIIATISPGHKDLEETLSTLDYAHRAKNIQNKPELNQKLTKKTVLKEYTEEIDRLKRDLIVAREKNGIYLAVEAFNDMNFKLDCQNKELNEKMLLLKVLKDEMLNKERIFNEVSLNLVEKTEQLKKTEIFLNETKTVLDQTKKVLTTTKRRYKEKKVILTNHIKTEEELSGQANTLLQVADKVTEEHLKLQDTLERRKDVDNVINTVCEQFKEKMKLTFNSMNKDMLSLCTTHKSISSIIKEEVNNNINCHNNYTSQATVNIDQIAKFYENSFYDIKNSINEYSDKIANTKDDNKKLLNTMCNDLKEQETNRYNDLKLFLNNWSKQIVEQNAIQDEQNNRIHKAFVMANNSVKSYTEVTQSKYKNITENISKSLENAISKFDENILSQEQQLIEQIKKQTNENRKNLQVFKNITFDLMNSNKNCAEDIDNLRVKLNNDISEIECININSKEESDANFKIHNEQLMAEISVTDKLFIDRLKSIDELTKTNSDNYIKELNLEEYNKNSITTKIQDANTNGITNCDSVKKPIMDENNRIKSLTTQQDTFINSLDSNIQKYSNNFIENLKSCSDILNNFHENELKTYTSTGETPIKKNFSYPKSLASTSPHEIIVRRFRRENQWSDDNDSTILEDTENNITDLSDYFIPINSTPIKGVNYDRSKNIQYPDRIILSSIDEQLSAKTFNENLNSIIDCDISTCKNSIDLCNSNQENKENVS